MPPANGATEAIVRWPALIAVLALLSVGGGGAMGWIANRQSENDEKMQMIGQTALEAKLLAISSRPDPWTGKDAKQQRQEILREISERDTAILDVMRRECRLNIEKIEARFRAVEHDVEQCHEMLRTGHARWFLPQESKP